jgi:hypothetical protein
MEKTPNLICYNYYGCYFSSGWYERPIWYRMQNDLQLYAENGLVGLTPTIYIDNDMIYNLGRDSWNYTLRDLWAMNILTHWLYTKLAWNPNEDVDALIEYFCDKVYGAASEHMKEYYRLVKLGWDDGAEYLLGEFNSNHKWNTNPAIVYDTFIDIEVDGIQIADAIREVLDQAWEVADDRAKEHIRRPRECFAD